MEKGFKNCTRLFESYFLAFGRVKTVFLPAAGVGAEAEWNLIGSATLFYTVEYTGSS